MVKRMSVVVMGLTWFAACGDGGGEPGTQDPPPVVRTEAGAVVTPDGGSPPAPPPASCDKSWILGSTFYTCPDCGMGQKCSPTGAPKNCADGSFLKFDDGDCRCVVNCGSFPSKPGEGAVCDKAGEWHCRTITNGSGSSGLMCVPDAWNLCTKGGSPPPTSSDAGTPPPSCKQPEEACTGDSECCSGICADTCF